MTALVRQMLESPPEATLGVSEERSAPLLSLTCLEDTESLAEVALKESLNAAVEEAPLPFLLVATEESSTRGEGTNDPLSERTLERLRGIASSRINETRRSVEEEERGSDDVSVSLSSSLMRHGDGDSSMTSSLWK